MNGGKPGDLMLNVRIAPHPRYTRTGNDLRCKQSVELLTAVLGGKTRVQTLHGEKVMTIQSGTQFGAVLRMRGLGMPVYDVVGTYGDLYVEIMVDIPHHLSEAERELYDQLAKLKQPVSAI
jgi:curved DNA-binding protein